MPYERYLAYSDAMRYEMYREFLKEELAYYNDLSKGFIDEKGAQQIQRQRESVLRKQKVLDDWFDHRDRHIAAVRAAEVRALPTPPKPPSPWTTGPTRGIAE